LIGTVCGTVSALISGIIAPGIYGLLQGIDIINSVFIDKQGQTSTDDRNIQGNDTGKSPLQ